MAYLKPGSNIPKTNETEEKKKMNKFRSSLPIAMAVLALSSTNMFATPIPITGTGEIVKSNGTANVAVSSNGFCISFANIAPACSGTNTPFNVSAGSDSVFKTGLTGTITDICPACTTVGWETVQTSPTGSATFDLESIITPTGYASCGGVYFGACSTGFFVLSQISSTQVQIGIALNEIGYVTGTSSASHTNYVGNFSTTLSGSLTQFGCVVSLANDCTDTIANVLQFESGAGHSVNSTWAATESPVPGVPEPATLSMMGIGLVGLGLVARRRKNS
jgi:hypothetical protein